MEFFRTLKKVFSPREEHSRGRLCILASGILASIAAQFTGGVFYTGFLLLYGIDVVSIGILTFIPSLACLLNIFSPSILERYRLYHYRRAGKFHIGTFRLRLFRMACEISDRRCPLCLFYV